jgi:hypothetical protein
MFLRTECRGQSPFTCGGRGDHDVICVKGTISPLASEQLSPDSVAGKNRLVGEWDSPKGDYAFDAGIVIVSFESEGQEFSVMPLDPQEHFQGQQMYQKVYQDATFEGCDSFSSGVMLSLPKERSEKKGSIKIQGTVEAGAYLHQRYNRPSRYTAMSQRAWLTHPPRPRQRGVY